MKKYKGCFFELLLAIVIIFISLHFLFGCHDIPAEAEKVLIGYVTVIGNEPFTHLALIADDGTYILKCNKETNNELWCMQGTKVVIYYTTIEVEEGIKAVNVIRYAVWR